MVIPGIRGLSLKDFLRQMAKSYGEVGVSESAAQLSYYLLFALFPFLFFLVTLTAYLPVGPVVQDLLLRAKAIMPGQVLEVIEQHLDQLLHQPRPKLLVLVLAVSVYSASRGVDSMRTALNRAYKVTESRPWWATQLLSIGMTVIGTLLIVLAFAGVILGGRLGFWIFSKLRLRTEFLFLWVWLRWPVTALIVMLATSLAYYFLPDVRQRFKFMTPGSLSASVFWLVATWGFTFYTDHFHSYNVTYGSIGSAILMLTWFYLSAEIFLLGGITNVVIEHSSLEGKEPGTRMAGEPAPPVQARLLAQTPGASRSRRTAQRLKGLLMFRRHRPISS